MDGLKQRLAGELASLGDKRAVRAILGSAQGARAKLNGREVIVLSSTNYLGLAGHPEVVRGAVTASETWGAGTASGPRICGVTTLHRDLETRLARLVGTEEAVLYSSAFQANVGFLACVPRQGDTIFSDELNHASIIDGCRLSKAATRVYRHNDLKHLLELLRSEKSEGLRFIITDGVFSMDGDLAPVPDLLEICGSHDAILCVDDAHGIGVAGRTGRGVVEHFGVLGQVPVIIGTLGKALGGGVGGFVAGSADLAAYLVQHSRTYRFTNTVPPAAVGAALSALDVAERDPDLRSRLWGNVDYFRSGIKELGFAVVESVTPIVPILTYDEGKAFAMGAELLKKGVFVQAYGFPVVPKGLARLRAIVSAAHTRADLDEALEAFRQVHGGG